MAEPPSPLATVWTDEPRAAHVAAVFDAMGTSVAPIGVGGPSSAAVNDLAGQLDCVHEDDLRRLLVEHPAAFVLLATWRGVNREDIDIATSQGTTILALEPATVPLPQIDVVPAFGAAPGWTRSAAPAEVLGETCLVNFTSLGSIDECSLFARLFDAWRVVLQCATLPERIDATLSGPLGEVPEDLRGVTGHLAAHARLAGSASALVAVSDRAGPQRRRLHVIAATGQWDVDDATYQLRDADGQLVDPAEPAESQPLTFAQLIAAQWQGYIEQREASQSAAPPGPPAPADADILACCQACLLSARTGEPENPRRLREMQRLN